MAVLAGKPDKGGGQCFLTVAPDAPLRVAQLNRMTLSRRISQFRWFESSHLRRGEMCTVRRGASVRLVAHSETIVRNHSATVCSELVVESQTGRVAASGWCAGITVENSPTPHLSRIGNEKQASRQVGQVS